MAINLGSRIKHAWNAFTNNRDPTASFGHASMSYGYRPDRIQFSRGNERSIVTAIFNKIALDVAQITILHAQLDGRGRYTDTINSGLNNCLTLEANIDQTGRALIHDLVASMFDEGCVALIPIDIGRKLNNSDYLDICTMRTAKILEWYPDKIRVRAYDERTGEKKDIFYPKNRACIIENPFFAVMNEPNSTLQRLIRKLNLLDAIDEQSGSGKLDLIIQLPYVVKSEVKRKQADDRRVALEQQLAGSKYGIGYIDGTERITQLNRPVENNLLKQIEYLTDMLYSQLGITKSVLDGTADERTMLNYHSRTIEPIVSAIADEMKRKFLSQTARDKGQSIVFFRDPFKLVPVGDLAETADKLTRNEIMTSNEIRQIIGLKPSDDPKADQLVNSNITQPTDSRPSTEDPVRNKTQEVQNGT